MAKGEQWLNGKNGTTYVDGKKVMTQVSLEFKVTGNFEEMSVCGDMGTSQSYGGYSVEGTLKKYKIDSEFASETITGFVNGTPKYYKIIVEIENKYNGKKEIWALDGVVFTELGVNHSSGEKVEEELPFKAESVELLEEI